MNKYMEENKRKKLKVGDAVLLQAKIIEIFEDGIIKVELFGEKDITLDNRLNVKDSIHSKMPEHHWEQNKRP